MFANCHGTMEIVNLVKRKIYDGRKNKGEFRQAIEKKDCQSVNISVEVLIRVL